MNYIFSHSRRSFEYGHRIIEGADHDRIGPGTDTHKGPQPDENEEGTQSGPNLGHNNGRLYTLLVTLLLMASN